EGCGARVPRGDGIDSVGAGAAWRLLPHTWLLRRGDDLLPRDRLACAGRRGSGRAARRGRRHRSEAVRDRRSPPDGPKRRDHRSEDRRGAVADLITHATARACSIVARWMATVSSTLRAYPPARVI